MNIKILMRLFLLGIIVSSVILNGCEKEDYSQDNGEFKDLRDNKEYKWLKIGDQIWMAENLAYTGSEMQHITVDLEWCHNTAYNAWCYYDNNSNNADTYGVLYQWEAAKTACPDGWHLPTDEEWTQMENYLKENGYSYDGLVGNNGIAKSLAADNAWSMSDVQGDVGNSDFPEYRNKSGFSAFPGGNRYYLDGTFNGLGMGGYWWSATEDSDNYAYSRCLYYNNAGVLSSSLNKLDGFSVRCVKDSE